MNMDFSYWLAAQAFVSSVVLLVPPINKFLSLPLSFSIYLSIYLSISISISLCFHLCSSLSRIHAQTDNCQTNTVTLCISKRIKRYVPSSQHSSRLTNRAQRIRTSHIEVCELDINRFSMNYCRRKFFFFGRYGDLQIIFFDKK
mgnify:CR=1 FL=1